MKALRQAGLTNAEQAFIFFHGLGLEHIDMELTSSRPALGWVRRSGAGRGRSTVDEGLYVILPS